MKNRGLFTPALNRPMLIIPKGVDGCGNGGGIIFAFGYVHFNRNGFAVATGVDFVRYILCEIYVEVAETNIGALRGEMYCVRGAHALCGARDQDVFSQLIFWYP